MNTAKLLHWIYSHIYLQNNFHSHFQRFCSRTKWDFVVHPNERHKVRFTSPTCRNLCLKQFSITVCCQTRMFKFVQLLIFILCDTAMKEETVANIQSYVKQKRNDLGKNPKEKTDPTRNCICPHFWLRTTLERLIRYYNYLQVSVPYTNVDIP